MRLTRRQRRAHDLFFRDRLTLDEVAARMKFRDKRGAHNLIVRVRATYVAKGYTPPANPGLTPTRTLSLSRCDDN